MHEKAQHALFDEYPRTHRKYLLSSHSRCCVVARTLIFAAYASFQSQFVCDYSLGTRFLQTHHKTGFRIASMRTKMLSKWPRDLREKLQNGKRGLTESSAAIEYLDEAKKLGHEQFFHDRRLKTDYLSGSQ